MIDRVVVKAARLAFFVIFGVFLGVFGFLIYENNSSKWVLIYENDCSGYQAF